MKWLLLLWIYAYGPTGAATSAEFETKEACELAGQAFEQKLKALKGGASVYYVCAPSR